MTGFGAASARTEQVQVTVELSSVNRKQLDTVVRLPPQLAAFESRVQKIIQEQISRGRISGNVQLEAASGAATMQINLPRAEETVNKLRRAAKKLNLKDDLSASLLLQLSVPDAESVSVEENWPVPVTSRVFCGLALPMPTAPPAVAR